MEDYYFSLPKKHVIAAGERHWRDKNTIAETRVCKEFNNKAPYGQKTLSETPAKRGTRWWDCKPDQVAIDQRFIEGGGW
jgi:hypothetical protein